ncbi:MAG TPA: alpha/beta fold hydrolase [Deltaproteobacteria bacterium]|nr:alpha/beta fold hydrolase [Deltaproteobacteria bacterium]
MAQIKVPGAQLEILDTHEGDETICFSHGLLFSHELYQPQIEALRGRHRCVAWDHRGQGASSVPPGRIVTIETVTADAIALIEALQIAPVHFVGLSMGGFVGLRIAARRPDLVRSLILLETAADPEPTEHLRRYRALNLAARTLGIQRWLADRVLKIMCGASVLADPSRAPRVDRIRGLLMANARSVYKAVNGVLERDGVEHELSQIRCPTLVVRAREDAAIALPRARQLVEGIAGAQWVELPRGGHSCTLEEPEAVNEALMTFLDALPRAGDLT